MADDHHHRLHPRHLTSPQFYCTHSLLVSTSEIKQKNEGGWSFHWDEDSHPGSVLLDIKLSPYLDSSLVDVDLHPHHINIVIKGKV
jgi:hypothetical protein